MIIHDYISMGDMIILKLGNIILHDYIENIERFNSEVRLGHVFKRKRFDQKLNYRSEI